MQKLVDKIKKLNIKVLDKKEDIYPYAFDTAPLKNKITPPLCVCFPKTTEDIQKLIIFASKNGLNIVRPPGPKPGAIAKLSHTPLI